MRSPRGTRCLLAAVVVLALLLAGCSAIPRSGPVGTSQATSNQNALTDYTFNPPGPALDADQQAIVNGFIGAGSGPQEDYKVAREFLAPSKSGDWNAIKRTIVFSGNQQVLNTSVENEYSVQFEVEAEIDEHGVLTEMPANTTETVKVSLVQVDGQWRISAIPDGTMISAADFQLLFAPHTLYFYDASYGYGVPDVRWFVTRQGLPAAIVSALLAGPAPYLRNAVFSAFPEGSTLVRQAVPIESGRATVDLVQQVFDGAPDLRRQQMQQQLTRTLAELNTVSSVTMTVDQREVDLGAKDPGFTPWVVDPPVGSTQIAVFNNELVYYEGSAVVGIGRMPGVAGFGPRYPAMSSTDGEFAFLNRDRSQLLIIGEDRILHTPVSGTSLTPPSVDVHGWAWTVDNGTRQILAVPYGTAENTPARIAANWFDTGTIEQLKISSDGARALVVLTAGGQTKVLIAGVVRESDGVPKALTEPLELTASVPVDTADWVSESSVVVMAADPDAPVEAELLKLGGEPTLFAPLEGMVGISAGDGEDTIYAQTAQGIFIRVGNSWRPLTAGVTDPSFPG